jgi:hypothetical protein
MLAATAILQKSPATERDEVRTRRCEEKTLA